MDIDDTTRCPVAPECEVCFGQRGALLDVVTFGTPVGVYCATICEACEDDGLKPGRIGGWTQAVDRVLLHCAHLGIDADQMAAAMAAEEE